MIIPRVFQPTVHWMMTDYRDNPLRFVLELLAWIASLVCAIIMAMTLPNVPFLILYPMFLAQCGIFAWSAYSRRSTGMFANYCLLCAIDAIGYIRLLLTIPY